MPNKQFILFLIFILACSKEKPIIPMDIPMVLKIDNSNLGKIETLNMSSISSEVDYVTLKFNINSADTLIGEIDHFSVTNNGYVLTDKRITKSIYVFDFEGHFRSKISRIGNGPGEYLKITDVQVTDNTVTIYDSNQGKFISYDLDGVLKHEYKLEYFVKSFFQTSYGTLVYPEFFDQHHHRLLFLNKEGGIINKVFPYDKLLFGSQVGGPKPFHAYRDSITFIQPYDNIIYRVVEHNVTPRYYISFSKNPLPIGYLDDVTIHDKFTDVRNNDYPSLLGVIVEDDTFLIFQYNVEGYVYTAFCNKSNGDCNSYNLLINDHDQLQSPTLSLAQDGYFYALLTPSSSSMQENFEKLHTTERFKNIFYQNGGDGGNPIIMRYKTI